MSSGKILVAQGGGPTAVINQSLVGVALEARRFRSVDTGLRRPPRRARHRRRGLRRPDAGNQPQPRAGRRHAVLGARLDPRQARPQRTARRSSRCCARTSIGHFFYIGGNDSSDTVRIVSQEAQKAGYPLRCIHIPKTIDNDLVGNDHTPGFPSAARFVAQAFAGANLDNAALPGVYVGVVMGRHAGFLTAASALGKKFPDDGPHLIYLPERTFVLDRFLADVKAALRTLRPLRDRGLRRHPRRLRRADRQPAGQGPRTRRARQCAAVRHRRAGRPAVRGNQVQARHQARARRHLRLPAALASSAACRDVDQREAREVGEKAVQFAHVGRTRRLGRDPAHRLLLGRLRPAAAAMPWPARRG